MASNNSTNSTESTGQKIFNWTCALRHCDFCYVIYRVVDEKKSEM